MTKKIGYKDFW